MKASNDKAIGNWLLDIEVAVMLIKITQDAIDSRQTTLKSVYDEFIDARADDVEAQIKNLLI